MDKLNAISVFCRVIETQSFTQTAIQQNISVAMVSKLITQLETQLQTRLLQRTTRKIMPTEMGMLYYQHCQPILLELEEAEAKIRNHTRALCGNLSVSVPRDFGLQFITPNLSLFIKQYPELQIKMEFSDRKVDLVSEGYDLALRIGNLPDSSLMAKKIATSSMHVVASPEYLAQKGTPLVPEELHQHTCLLYDTPSGTNWQFQHNHKNETLRIHSKFICNNGLTLKALAKSGIGIINTPKFFIEQELKSGELVEVLKDFKQQTLELNVVYPHRRYLSAKVKAFTEFLMNIPF